MAAGALRANSTLSPTLQIAMSLLSKVEKVKVPGCWKRPGFSWIFDILSTSVTFIEPLKSTTEFKLTRNAQIVHDEVCKREPAKGTSAFLRLWFLLLSVYNTKLIYTAVTFAKVLYSYLQVSPIQVLLKYDLASFWWELRIVSGLVSNTGQHWFRSPQSSRSEAEGWDFLRCLTSHSSCWPKKLTRQWKMGRW